MIQDYTQNNKCRACHHVSANALFQDNSCRSSHCDILHASERKNNSKIKRIKGQVHQERNYRNGQESQVNIGTEQQALDVDLWEAIQSKADYAQSASTMMQNRNMMNMEMLSELPGMLESITGLFGQGGQGSTTRAIA